MRRRDEAALPPTGAGLMRYFREEAHGIKVSPKGIIGFTVAVIVLEIILRIYGLALLGF